MQAENCVIKIVDLSQNKIDDEGIIEISKGIRKNKTLLALNMNSNSICDEGAMMLVSSVKSNNTLEKFQLKFNTFDNKYLSEIEAKASANSANLKKIKVPQYKQEIRKIVVDKDLFDEIEWKTEQVRRERESVESEIREQYNRFEEIKKSECSKFNIIKAQYDKMLEDEIGMDKRIIEFDETSKKITKNAQSSINIINHKIMEVSSKISEMETSCK